VLLLTALGLAAGLALLPDYWDWDLHRLRAVIGLDVQRMASLYSYPLATAWERWRDERDRANARADTQEKARVTGSIEGLFDRRVTHLALQPDGKILAVGLHTLAGIGIARLHPDGTLDEEFVRRASWDHAGDVGGVPLHVEVAPDGGVIVSGSLNFRGASHARLRFHPDGTLDTSWLSQPFEQRSGPIGVAVPAWIADALRDLERPPVPDPDVCQSPEDGCFPVCGNDLGNASRVQFLALQPDGRALISRIRHGFFALIRASQDGGWEERPADGRVCATVSEGTATVTALAFQRDGGVVMAGDLPRWPRGSHGCEHVALWRIAPEGTLDDEFRMTSAREFGGVRYRGPVEAIILLGDGGILIGGEFTSVQGHARRNIARLRADGSVE
jgi:uncharacterized delta-60 repeat protein